jgi:galactoside 2-L-fucosyltransferase 1/2
MTRIVRLGLVLFLLLTVGYVSWCMIFSRIFDSLLWFSSSKSSNIGTVVFIKSSFWQSNYKSSYIYQIAPLGVTERRNYLTEQNQPILTIESKGRLGNLMFEYASAFCTAKRNGLRFALPANFSLFRALTNIFELTSLPLGSNRLLKEVNFSEKLACTYDQRTEDIVTESLTMIDTMLKNDSKHYSIVNKSYMNETLIVMRGYFQSWRYFSDCSDEIRREFTFKRQILAAADRFLSENVRKLKLSAFHQSNAINNNTGSSVAITTVGIHIRRGDMQRRRNLSRIGYKVAPLAYIQRAMDYFQTRTQNILFVICSDDVRRVANDLKEIQLHNQNVVFSFNSSRDIDMAILTLCDHVITTVGTFSWWAGWLNKGKVVYYAGYPIPNSTLDRVTNKADFYPPSWIGMD